ncbi:hypothetical protein BC830DRAFT_1086341 [Chytriomyces sp. MP71]|nr:hypothetical protein BC830DRAFT_1086341 [Chytriomyces sp. MP71]
MPGALSLDVLAFVAAAATRCRAMRIASLLLNDDELASEQSCPPSPTPSVTLSETSSASTGSTSRGKPSSLVIVPPHSLKYDPSKHYVRTSSSPTTPTAPKKPYNSLNHTCSECRKQFRRGHMLKSHMVSHSTDFPHACSLGNGCGARFRRKSDLLRHERNVKHAFN